MIGALSSVHLIGLTLITGSALVVGLRSFGLLLPDQPLAEVMRPASRAFLLGLAISFVTGFLMFLPRAESAAGNSTFQIKMFLLLGALVFQFTLYRSVTRSAVRRPPWSRLTGALGITLWFAVACAGCLFIVFE